MKKKFLNRTILFILSTVIFISIFNGLTRAPSSFPVPYRIIIEQGRTLFSISHQLEDDNVIGHSRIFEVLMIVLGSEKTISEGEYYFAKPVSVFEVAMRISGKHFGVERKKVTFPEGFTNKQIANRLVNTYEGFDAVLFMTLAKDYEGYLFPDTYRFFPSVTPDFVLSTLRNNFASKILPFQDQIEATEKSESDIIIMASLIEKEARGTDDRDVISGILWKRIEMGIPLQVDAPFLYILGKESKDLTKTDLAMNSPFNTYRYKGLPPAAISNPGLESIKASINPTPTDYLFYLHDSEGKIHYAKTYEEHKKNIKKYLNTQ